MKVTQSDLSILEKLELEIQPVGVRYLNVPPGEIEKLGKKMTLCEMLKEAQGGKAFYCATDNHSCDAGSYVLGQTELKEPYTNGQFGSGLGVFADARAAARIYDYVPRIKHGMAKYTEFAPLNRLAFDPDLLIIFARTSQAEILLRAMSYKSGQMWSSRYSSAIGCAWMFVQPYVSGEINFGTTGLGFGMKRRRLFPEGLQWISIPFTVLPSYLTTLREMPWSPRPYQADGLDYVSKLRTDLGLD